MNSAQHFAEGTGYALRSGVDGAAAVVTEGEVETGLAGSAVEPLDRRFVDGRPVVRQKQRPERLADIHGRLEVTLPHPDAPTEQALAPQPSRERARGGELLLVELRVVGVDELTHELEPAGGRLQRVPNCFLSGARH